MDTMSPEARSRLMSRIRGRDTKPEMLVRRYLHARGLRYIPNDKSLPGKPDLVFKSRKVAVFVHGCFWHGHEKCSNWRLPRSKIEYWAAKINGNRQRDKRIIYRLRRLGWRVHVLWACRLDEARLGRLYLAIAEQSRPTARRDSISTGLSSTRPRREP